MAASSKPTAVHFTLVAFVMFTLILGVLFNLKRIDSNEFQAKFTAEEKEVSQLSTAVDRLLAEAQEMKNLTGYPNTPDLGDPNQEGSVNAEVNSDIAEFGALQAGDTVQATFSRMRTEMNNLQNQVDTLNTDLETNREQLLATERAAQDRVDQIQSSQQESEEILQRQITLHEEVVAEKDAKIQIWRDDFRVLQIEKETVMDDYRRDAQEWEEREQRYIVQIDFLNDQVQELTDVSFERQDGRIVNVDNRSRSVWINLGHLDNLRTQTTFSVYTRDHRGIGRGVEDIKAKIEITRVLGPHIAEARIIEEDLGRPIGEDDPIYSPLWSAGRTEFFATVGRMDLDEDGDADVDQFHEIVHNAGAEIDFMVDDEGLRDPADASLSARTKFLVVGDMDDPADFSGQPERQDLAIRILEEHLALKNEARLYGIRVVGLNDFLEYIGFRPQQRLWQPGQERPFNLRNGARSASVGGTLENRISTGRVSELFRDNRGRSSSDDSSGTTSGLYRN